MPLAAGAAGALSPAPTHDPDPGQGDPDPEPLQTRCRHDQHRASNEPSRRMKLYDHREGPY